MISCFSLILKSIDAVHASGYVGLVCWLDPVMTSPNIDVFL
jgi:hypothetical protein